ncbi:MAG: thioesterase family protein [Cellvibrionales bacterium]|nr:thioesterase family protein [Cellvibrionales bacterium]
MSHPNPASHSRIAAFLQTERLEKNLFRGTSRDLGTPQVYGGQVLAQAIDAAQQTVEDRDLHSAHAHFLRRGDHHDSIIYEVERSRNGGSISSRRVVAIQQGRPIFTMSASFQAPQAGFEFQRDLHLPPPPQEDAAAMDDWAAIRRAASGIFGEQFSLSPVATDHPPGLLQFWIKANRSPGPQPQCHQAVLAYISDFGLLSAALAAQGLGHRPPDSLMVATIDHGLWLHRPCQVDSWLLYRCRALSNSGGRGLATGAIYDQHGTRIASSMQEGVIRPRRPIKPP